MTKGKIVLLLKDYDITVVERFASYIMKLSKEGWMSSYTEERCATLFKRVASDGLIFDGVHITLQSTGVSYDYVAYKNKMLITYPESLIDIQLVYTGDEFSVSKDSGKVIYNHKISTPFERDDKDIIGGYCVIKNIRGEFLTLLSKDELDKHRKVARTDFIWAKWYIEMCLKTLIKKACKQHYNDVFESIDEVDNENYNLDNPLDIEIDVKSKVDECKTIPELKIIYDDLKTKVADTASLNKYVNIRMEALKNENTSDASKK